MRAMERAATENYANIHRGVHGLAEAATASYEAARDAVRNFIGAGCHDSVVFTQGATASINLAAYSLGKTVFKKGDTILVSSLEHHANYLPWLRLAEELGTRLKEIPITPQGDLDMAALEAGLKSGAKLLAITYASNVLGTVPALKEIIALAHSHGCIVVVDAAQAVAHMPVSAQELDADLLAFSGHKLYGPTGIGALFVKPEIAEKMAVWQVGGGMVNKVGESFEKTTWAPFPYRFEAGTPPIIEVAGLKAAIDFVQKIGFKRIIEHEKELLAYALSRLEKIPGLKLYGAPSRRIGVISFNLGEAHPHDVGSILGAHGVAVRVGHHCAQPLMKELGIMGCVRVSLGLYNNKSDIDRLIGGLELCGERLV